MRHHPYPLRVSVLIHRLFWSVILAVTIPFVTLVYSQQISSTAADQTSDTVLTNPGTAAVRAYQDPETGNLVAPPDTVSVPEPSERMRRFSNTSTEGLEEKPAPGGGVMVDLKGRFGSTSRATQDQSGKMTISHASQSHEPIKPTETNQP